MLHRIRDRFGTAGLAVAIVALVAALAGTAVAASGALTGKQKKEVKNIAKQYAGKPGADGAAGPPGPGGPKGDTGAAGSSGKDGTNGKDGSSVTSKSLPIGNAHCLSGGSEFTASSGATYACNGEEGAEGPPGEDGKDGKDGNPWAVGGVVPPGETETGAYAVGQLPIEQFVYLPISFPIPLATGVDAHFLSAEEPEPTAECPGSAAEPEAEPGNLCVYEKTGFGITLQAVENPSTGEQIDEAGPTGAVLVLHGEEFASSRGTWAVTAPEG